MRTPVLVAVFAALAIAAIGVTAWFLWLAPTDTPLRDADIGIEVEDDRPLDARRDTTMPPAVDRRDETDEPAETEPETETEEVVEETYEKPVDGGIEVLVVNDATGEPVPGAIVFVMDERAVDEEEAMAAFMSGGGTNLFDLVRRFAKRWRCGDDGKVRVAGGGGFGGGVLAEKGDLTGMHDGALDPKGVEIRLVKTKALEVKVVDRFGAPVGGVPVSLRMKSQWMSMDMMRGTSDDESGLARIELFGPLLQQFGRMGMESDHVAALALPLAEPVEKKIDLENLPAAPVELVAPPTGSIRIKVLDTAGRPAKVRGMLSMRGRPADEPEPEAEVRVGLGGMGPFGAAGTTQAMLENGEVTIRHCGLGLRLDGEIGLLGRPGAKPLIFKGAGPTAPGETTTFEVLMEEDAAVLVGLLLDHEGRPVASARPRFELTEEMDGGSNTENGRLKTDAEGRFRFTLAKAVAEPGQRRSLRISHKEEGTNDRQLVTLDLAGAYVAGEHDLGEVRMVLPPIFVSGRVVDGEDAPIPGAMIWIQPAGDEDWEVFNELQSVFDWQDRRTDPQGRFVARSGKGPALFKINAQAEGYYGTVIEARKGQQDVVVRLRRGATVSGVLELSGGAPQSVNMSFTREDPAESDGGMVGFFGNDGNQFWGSVEKDGKFEFKGVRPGSYKLEFRLDDEQTPFHTVAGISVSGSGDVDLGTIRASVRVRRIVLEIVDGRDKPIAQGNVMIYSGEEQVGWEWFQNGEAIIETSKDALDMTVMSEGFQSVELRGVRSEEVRVVLRPAIEITVRIDSPAMVAEAAPYTLEAGASRIVDPQDGARRHRGGVSNVPLDASGEGRLKINQPGRYRVWIYLTHTYENGSTSTGVGNASVEVEIPENGLGTPVIIPVSAENLQRARDSMPSDR